MPQTKYKSTSVYTAVRRVGANKALWVRLSVQCTHGAYFALVYKCEGCAFRRMRLQFWCGRAITSDLGPHSQTSHFIFFERRALGALSAAV
jgi:hypothetical protein